jgi:hypothetical protein
MAHWFASPHSGHAPKLQATGIVLLLHRAAAGWLEHALEGGWETGELGGRTPWTRDELTAAIRTLPSEHSACARLAERALE